MDMNGANGMIFLATILSLMCIADAIKFNNKPHPAYIHENVDDDTTVWSVDVTCTVTTTCSYTASRVYSYTYWSGWSIRWGYGTRYWTAYYTCNKDVQCNSCSTRSNNMFYASGKNIRKRACTNRGCGPTCSSTYCMNAYTSYYVDVDCWHSSYYYNGWGTTQLWVYATASSGNPTISLTYGSTVYITNSYTTNNIVNYLKGGYPAGNQGYNYLTYSVADTSKFVAYDPYQTRTDKLFYLNGQYLRVTKSLASEYSYRYTGIQLCVKDRRSRSPVCAGLTIVLTGCFQIPTCNNQGPKTFSDQHGVGTTMFTMTYPNPTYPFTLFSTTWQGLQWSLASSSLDVAKVDGGRLTTSGAIIVWPAYPSKSYTATVRVGNTQSCGRTTTCTMSFTVTFTNFQIYFSNLPATLSQHENYDAEYRVIQITTSDQNGDHDNVTCEMTSYSPAESNMFQLRTDYKYQYNSYSVYRLACQHAKCEDTCPQNSGCFSYYRYTQYVINIKCYDFYGTNVAGKITLNIQQNTPPSFTGANLDTIYINKATHTADSYVTQFYVSNPDSGYDNDYIRYWITDTTKFRPWDYTERTDELFYLNTDTGFLYVATDLSMEYSNRFQDIQVCIRDRRHTNICRFFDIILTACYQIPTCQDQTEYSDKFWDTIPKETTLFNLLYYRPDEHFSWFRSDYQDLTWSLDSSTLEKAEVVQDEANGENEGILRTFGNVTVWPSYPYRDYQATVRVSNSESCGRTTTCEMNWRVYFTNWPISFKSLPNSMHIHENYDDPFEIHLIITYDYNNPQHDNVTCAMTVSPDEDNMFELVHEGFFKHDSWSIWRKRCLYPKCESTCPTDSGCFNHDITSRYEFTVTCRDAYGSSVEDIFELFIDDNSPPKLTDDNEAVVYITKDHNLNKPVTTIFAEDDDLDIDDDYIRWNITDDTKLIPWDYPNITRTDRLFYIDGLSGEIFVKADLSMEYSYVFRDIEICIADRRDAWICRDLTIWLTACYEIPTCYDQENLDFWDTHGVDETLFDLLYPNPTYHFPVDFPVEGGRPWLDLTWSLDETDLSEGVVVQNEGVGINEGIFRPYMNITVWPSWRYRDYYAIIRVSNEDSCGRETTCVLTFRIWFKNWPIRFMSLPDSMHVHENMDEDFLVHQIVTYDYNNPAHDNVTCEMVVSPDENNMFELVHDGLFKHDSWSIWRIPCLYSKCENLCPTDSGCFNHDIYPRYEFTVTCWDAYGSSVQDIFELFIDDNSPPYLTDANEAVVYITKDHNLNKPVTTIFAEDDDLDIDDDYIRWNITDDTKLIPWDYPNVTRTDRLFYIDGLTGEIFVKADLSMEYSYVFRDIEICIADRRDAWICRDLTIWLTACYEIPTCYDQENLDFWDTHGVDETLFDLLYPNPTYHFPVDFPVVGGRPWLDLTWSLDETDLSEGVVVQNEGVGINEGIFRPYMNITVWPSWRYRDYYAIIRVSNEDSCGRETTCVLTFRIWFKNWPIRFISLPDSMHMHENMDDDFLVHQIVTYDYNNPAHDNVTCEMVVSPDENNIFELVHDGSFKHDSWSIWRIPCQYPKCESLCPTNSGCFNHDIYPRYEFTVTCRDAYDSSVEDTFELFIDDNIPPYLTLKNEPVVYVSHDSHKKDEYVTTIFAKDDDLHIDDDYIRWNFTDDTQLIPWDYPNITRTDRLFYIDGLTGEIYVKADLSMEYSYVFRDIEICIADRRDSWICRELTIWLTQCYEIPTCYDQEYLDFWDTHGVEETLFDMKYPFPTYHFPVDFPQHDDLSWLDLTWSLDETDLTEGEIVQNDLDGRNEGIFRPYMNITVWPSWRYRDYYAIIRVNNANSCGRETTCVLTFRIWFKNWPIRFISLPDESTVNEDYNDEFTVHEIITYDYNNHLQDNVTCSMTVTPCESTDSFLLVHNGEYDYNSWSIVRKECPKPTCGFHCDKGIGCFTYNTTLNQQFVFTVHCWDAYDSDVTDDYILHLDYNRAPRFTNLPNTITVNSDKVPDKKLLYSIQYSDNENEDLYYNFTFSPDNGIWNDILIFQCDGWGNYYNNLANITSTVYYHGMPETTYYIYICGTERRNMICETLTIHVRDYCPENPTCTGDSRTIPDSTAIGEVLFTINGQQGAGSNGDLTYSFVSPTPAYFHVDQSSGDIFLSKTLIATYPSKTYQLTAYVYDSAACNYGSCQFTITSEFTNHPITIVNLPYTYTDLSEDTEVNLALVTIETEDDNTDDTVTCSITDITSSYTSDPIEQNLFRIKETFSGSNVWFIENRELPGFNAAILDYTIEFECHDKYGSSDTGSLYVTIKPNETPMFLNLDATTAIEVDPSLVGENSIIYVVLTYDEENDKLVFSSSVNGSFPPLALNDEGKVYLRRDVSIIDEDGVSYYIDICIDDPLHPLQPDVCGQLNVTFISSQKYPVISNLPNTTSLPEDTPGGSTIFDVDVYDENVDSVHTFSMTVDPLEAEDLFSLHAPTGILTLQASSSFDYEERDVYTFTFAVKDQYLDGLEKKVLVLNITNVNEAPTITITEEYITFDEDTEPGKKLAKKVATCSDVDTSDSHTFSIENGTDSEYFDMQAKSSRLKLAQEWDLESRSCSAIATLYIVCTDSGGLIDKKPIHVTVSPVNEFDPVISPTTMEVNIDPETTVVETLGQITSVNDSDCGDDGNFLYKVLGVGRGEKYFTMTQSGQLKLKQEMTFSRDKDFEFTIGVSDEDDTPQSRTAYCTVTVHYTAPPEDTPEEPTYCTTCTTEGKLVMLAFAVEGLIMCGLIAHCAHHCYSLRRAKRPKLPSMPKASRFNKPMNPVLAPPTNVPKPTPKSTTTTQVKPAVNSIKQNPTVSSTRSNPALNSTNPNQRVPNKRAHPSRPNPAVGATVITGATTVSGIGSSTAVGQTAPPQPQPFSEQPQNQQDNIPSDDDTSLSEDSDIDERLQDRSNQPRNQGLPSGIDAATVSGQFPNFGAFNYA